MANPVVPVPPPGMELRSVMAGGEPVAFITPEFEAEITYDMHTIVDLKKEIKRFEGIIAEKKAALNLKLVSVGLDQRHLERGVVVSGYRAKWRSGGTYVKYDDKTLLGLLTPEQFQQVRQEKPRSGWLDVTQPEEGGEEQA